MNDPGWGSGIDGRASRGPGKGLPPARVGGVLRGRFRDLVKGAAHLAGYEIRRTRSDAVRQLLGLRGLPFRSIVDVGANTGQFARRALALFPGCRLYCFEPLAGPFERLARWARAQGDAVAVFNVAVGDAEGPAQALEHVDHPESSSLLPVTPECVSLYPFTERQMPTPVAVTTLDAALASRLPLAGDVLIKIDVQGYEDRVIRGGRRTFAGARACIVEVGLDRLYQGQATFAQVVALLAGLDYGYAGNLEQAIAGDGHVVAVDAVFVKGR